MHSGAALPRARQVESAKLLVAQGQGAVSPFHIGTRALAHGRQPLALVPELVLGLGTQRAQDATRLKQRGASPLGELPTRRAIADGPRLGHAIAITRGEKRGMQGTGDGRGQVARSALLPHLT